MNYITAKVAGRFEVNVTYLQETYDVHVGDDVLGGFAGDGFLKCSSFTYEK